MDKENNSNTLVFKTKHQVDLFVRFTNGLNEALRNDFKDWRLIRNLSIYLPAYKGVHNSIDLEFETPNRNSYPVKSDREAIHKMVDTMTDEEVSALFVGKRS